MCPLPFVSAIASPSPTFLAVGWLGIGMLGAAILGRGWVWVKETTLAAPLAWGAFSLTALVGSELLIVTAVGEPAVGWTVPLRFAATMTTFCPAMAVLGAKRPQDRGWQFIVLSLWVLLLAPGFQAALFAPGEPIELFAVWSWFLLVLMLVGLANYLPTRYWLSSLLFFAGQGMLLGAHLPVVDVSFGAGGRLLAALLFVAAAALVGAGWPRGRRGATPLDQVWIDFRDQFGAAWGLRVLERLRANAALEDWRLAPTWNGFAAQGEKPPSAEELAAVERALRSLLRRFVSPQWIADRWRNT